MAQSKAIVLIKVHTYVERLQGLMGRVEIEINALEKALTNARASFNSLKKAVEELDQYRTIKKENEL